MEWWFELELRELGRKPPRKDMSGSELEEAVIKSYGSMYWSESGPRAIQTRRPWAWTGRVWTTSCGACRPEGRVPKGSLRCRKGPGCDCDLEG